MIKFHVIKNREEINFESKIFILFIYLFYLFIFLEFLYKTPIRNEMFINAHSIFINTG